MASRRARVTTKPAGTKKQVARTRKPKPRSTARGQLSRERILEAAIDVVGEHGFRSTTVDSVCRRAGVPKTSIYWHFGSKDGLFAALIERIASEWTAAIQQRAYAAGPNPVDRLDHSLAAMREFLETKPHLLRLMLTLTFEPVRVSSTTRAALRRASSRAESAITDGIQQSVAGALPDLDLVANLILAMLQAASVRMLIDPRGFDADRHFADLRRLVVLAVGHRIQETLARRPR
jgi:AcrR family transcriptional regulator